ncbi:hypothetical protein [Mesoterricola silvestris]|uniref:Uncharacterized protein n=1 Tax=Mesoterricola silvestris TaxID=2927979 RepID=A0AA48GJM4_9BACT|nr:hypothetical protein [Mesoterricola silvestris]BDU74216.1 hypothetical protein METEAL_33900 [Mesoterricola silvestris]
MRLVPFFLSALALCAQTPGKLPWDAAAAVPWKAGDCGPLPAPPRVEPIPAGAPIQARITADGTLRVTDGRGMILLRTGLPGRPLQVWRDGGIRVESPGLMRFSGRSLLTQGIGALPVKDLDFRPALEGLLWILSDDERVITLIHPATAHIIYLPLPGGRAFQLVFHPDRLELRQGPESGSAECWSVPWMALLPQLLQLGRENPANRPSGTALLPFPKG